MKKVIIILVALIILAGGGFFAYTKFFKKEEKKNEEKKVDVSKLIESRVTMEPITTHLISPSNYVIIALDVQTSSIESKEEFELRIAEMKSATITTINSLDEDILRKENGTKDLINTLKAKFNKILTNGEVTDIFITDYKLQ